MRTFYKWFLWKALGRTPMLWEDFGRLKRRGYYELDREGKRGVFIEAGTDQIYI